MENKEFPTWDEAILGITDPRLKDKIYSKIVRYYVEAGARIMYDRLCSMLSSDAVLTSDMHSDGDKPGQFNVKLKTSELPKWKSTSKF